jgi:hypothetical protein
MLKRDDVRPNSLFPSEQARQSFGNGQDFSFGTVAYSSSFGNQIKKINYKIEFKTKFNVLGSLGQIENDESLEQIQPGAQRSSA